MRTSKYISLLSVAAVMAVTGCTVKDVDQPAFAGPSTFAHSIVMVADRHTLTQNGVDFTDIRLTSISPTGQSENIPLRAQVFVDGVAQDYGTLSSKSPVTPATIRYTAPNASTLAGGQVPTTVTIAVTPSGSGDFRSEFSRQLDIRLEPQGIILPTNPSLAPAFTVSPQSPQAFQTTTFDASTTANGASACLQACSYAWNFGDGTTASGITTTKTFTAPGNYPVTLVITDSRGAQASTVQVVTVSNVTPPTGTVSVSPTPPVGTETTVFFNASNITWPGRTITGYSWNFGDGTSGSGVTTTHRYGGIGTYNVVLTVTDSAGAQSQLAAFPVQVTAQGGASAQLTATPTSGRPGQRVVFDASASVPSTGAVITSYRFDYGDGDPTSSQETSTHPVQSHVYNSVGTFVASVEITDSNGKKSTRVVTITINP